MRTGAAERAESDTFRKADAAGGGQACSPQPDRGNALERTGTRKND